MLIPSVEVQVKLSDKGFDKQVDAKILEVEKKFASIGKTSSIAPNIDSTKLKNQANSLRVDLAKKIKEIEKELELEPTIDSKQINDDLKDVRQDISAFNDRVNSDEAKTYAQRLSQIKAVKKELTALKRIAEKTGEKTIADELGAKLEIVSKKVTQANAELTNFVKTGENNVSVLGKLFNNVTKEIEESRNELKKLGASTKQLDKLERSIESINKDFKAGKITAKQYAQGLESIKESSRKATQQSQGLKNALTKVASAAAGFAVFSKAKDYVIEMDGAMTKLAISTGGTQKELDSFKDSARNLQSEGFGDFNKNIESLSQVQRQLKLTGEEAEKVAKTGLLIDQGFGISSKESIDALDKAMKGFGVSSQEASDILINGLQNSGDASGDFIDTVREYSSQIGEAGGSFQQFVNKILVAEELGIRNTDQFADLYRESIIRVKDASDKTKEGFKDLGLSYDDFVQGLSDGTITVEEQIGIISNKILEIEDPIIQNQIATDLLGTKFEDNGIVAVEALASIQNKLPELEGATDRAGLVVEQSLGGRWAKLKGQILPILESIGLSLVNFILNITNTISVTFNGLTKTIPNAVKSMMDFVATNFSNGWNNIIGNTIGSLKSIVSNVEMFLGGLGTKAIQWGGNIVSSFVNGIKNQFPLLTSVVGSAAKIVTDFLAVFSPTNKGPLAQDQSIWGKNLISEINKGILSKKGETEKVMKEIADTIGKPIDAPEVSEIFNKLKQQEDNLIKEEEKREKLRQSLVKEGQEKRRKESEKTFQELEKSQDKIQDSIKKTREEYGKLREETEKLKDEALETIRGINNEIKNLEKGEGEDLADRALDLEEERAKILEKISNEKIKQIDIDLEGELTASRREKLEFKRSQQVEKELQRLERDRTLTQEQLSIKESLAEIDRESEIINGNITQQQKDQVREYENLSKAEQILFDNRKKRAELEEELLLQQAVSEGREIKVEFDEEENSLKAFIENEKGELIELQDFKNIQSAADTQAKREKLLREIDETKANLNIQLQQLDDNLQQQKQAQQDYTNFHTKEWETRGEAINDYISKIDEIQAKLQKASKLSKALGIKVPNLGGGGGEGSTTTITNNIEVNNATAGAAVASTNTLLSNIQQ